MIRKNFEIDKIPALLLGDKSDKVILFIHGKCGNKEEAARLFPIAQRRGYQVLSIDLPEHGERKNGSCKLLPWVVIPELKRVMEFANQQYKGISLYANSVGAYFSMLAFRDNEISQSLFVSPIVSMQRLISDMMRESGVTEERLLSEKDINTDFGETLSYDYYSFANENPVIWEKPTYILYASHDNLTSLDTVTEFAEKSNARLTVMEGGEHWFHTKEQLEFLNNWIEHELK